MKLSKFAVALTAAVILAPASQAFADPIPGWYLDAGVGINFARDSEGHTPAGDPSIKYDPGESYLGGGGYSFDNGLRAEGEVFHSRSNVKYVSGASSTNGHIGNTDFFGNGFYDFRTGTVFTPYVGAGVGLALASADNIGVLPTGGYVNENNKLEFAYQGIAGVAAQLDHNWALTLDYRYIASLDPDFHVTTGGNSSTTNAQHDIIFGVRYSFGEPAAPVQTTTPPQPMAKPAPKVAVAPVPQSYMVFFDFNKADLTPEAKRILASAAQDYKRGGYVRIVVTGHTDTVGSTKYNMTLSDRRAAAVKAELSRLGIDTKFVAAKGVGKDGQMVPTEDQVREAQNRRAEIVFDRK